MSKILVNERSLLGAVAEWAVKQSPYHRPDNLELVLDTLHNQLADTWKTARLGFIEFDTPQELTAFVSNHLRQIPEYAAWNERKNGNDAPYKFTSAYDTDGDPDDDFIDLDALEGNVTGSILAGLVD